MAGRLPVVRPAEAVRALHRDGWEAVKRRYTVLLEENPGGIYTATVPLLPGCVTQGGSIREALMHVQEAIEGYLELLQRDGEEIPEEEGPFALAAVEVDVAEGIAALGDR